MSTTVGSILADLFTQVGLTSSQYDVSQATDVVDGFVITDRTAMRSAVENLLRAYSTVLAEVDGKIVAVKRGAAPALTVANGDLAARLNQGGTVEAAPHVEVRRLQELELPFRLDLTFFTRARHYQQSQQGAQRYSKAALQDAVTIQLPLVLLDTQGRQLAEQLLYQQWVERQQFTFALPYSYLQLAPGDVINLPVLGQTLRCRVIQIDVGLFGPLQVTAVQDDLTILTQTVSGAATLTAGEEAADVQTTTLVAWTGPALVDADAASVGLYVATAPATAGYWPGCTIYWSRDGGTTYTELVSITDAAILGTATTVLAGNPATGTGAFDDADTVTVNVPLGGMPASTTDSDVVNGANAALLGDEVIQFGTIATLGGGSYQLSHLLRARRGSDSHWSEHVASERFAILDTGQTTRVTVGADLKGKQLFLKAVTANQALANATAQTLYVTGDEYRDYMPVQFAGTRSGPGDLALTWVRRARTNAEMRDGSDIPLGEATESYSVFVLANNPKTITSPVTLGASTVFTSTAHGFVVNDQLLLTGLFGPVYLNGRVVAVTAATTNTFTIADASLGMPAYVSGGSADKVLRTIAAATQSASYSASSQTTDFGSAQNPVKLAVAQNGLYGAGWPTVALI